MVLFRPEACPAGCHACADICPSNALHREDGGVRLRERLCIFCGACRNVCPVEGALEIRRERIAHHPVRSHLWTEMQGKLVSREAKLRLMEDIARRKRQRAFRTRID
jgi:Fe-S-cluster-containing hydrogenase component 2